MLATGDGAFFLGPECIALAMRRKSAAPAVNMVPAVAVFHRHVCVMTQRAGVGPVACALEQPLVAFCPLTRIVGIDPQVPSD